MAWILSAFADEAGPTTDEQVAALKTAGIDHIDPRNVDGHNIVDLPLDLAREVRAKYDAGGITVNMYGSPMGKIDIADDFETDLARLEHLAKLRDILGSNAVRIFSYYNKQEASDADWRGESLKRLTQLAEMAAKLDMVLYHENERHIFGDAVANVEAIRDEVRAQHGDHFRMIFDFDNYNQGGQDVWEAWQRLGEATDAIHFKESKRQPDGGYQHVPMGQGDGHVVRIMTDLRDRGWNGPITLEPHLSHSAAVMATGPSGQANQALKDMTPAEVFQLAAEAGIAVLKEIGQR